MKKILYLICALIFFKGGVLASHIVGGEITCACTATPGVYKVTITLFRDCSGIPLCNCPGAQGCLKSLTVVGADNSCNGTALKTFNVTAVPSLSGFDVIPVCSSITTSCSNCSTRTPGSFTPGIERYVFEGTVDLNSIPVSCCKVRIGFTECCRNHAITTGGAGENYYLEAIINRCIQPCNSSPIFTNQPLIIACNGKDVSYNPGAIDPDGDSLSYRLAPSLSGPGTSITYNTPYSPTVPFPFLGAPNPNLPAPAGLSFEATSGYLRFRPMGNFVSMLVMEVTEWRKQNGTAVVVGVTRRDIQFYSVSCPANTLPTFCTYDENNIPTTPACARYDYATCAGQPVCFYVEANDDTSDSTDILWDNGTMAANPIFANGATFQPAYSGGRSNGPKHDMWKFCWTPPANVASNTPYYFSVTATDRMCPLPGRYIHSFSVLVRPIPNAIINKTITGNSFSLSYTLTGKVVPVNSSYTQWKIENAPGSGTYTTVNGSTISNHAVSAPGVYKVILRLTTTAPPAATAQNPYGGCPNDSIVDSVDVKVPIMIPELAGLSHLILYPNPAHDAITIRASETEHSDYILELFSMDGRLMNRFAVMNNEPELLYEIPLEGFAKGIYLLKVRSAQGEVVTRFIKE